MKIHPVEAELFHKDRRTYRLDKGNSRISQFCERASLSSTIKREFRYLCDK
jgi:hypothetical protein